MSEDFEKSILDFNDDINNLDVKIKPNYYIHMALLMAQRTLMISVLKSDIREGITAYSVLIEHIEMLCRASKYISESYDEDIKKYITEDTNYKKAEGTIQLAKLSNMKLQLLMREVFGRSPSEAPLSDKKEL